MTAALANSLPPAVPSPARRGVKTAPDASGSLASGAALSFDEQARSILATDPTNDTAAALDAALSAGDREIARLEAAIDEAQKTATDIMSAAEDAASAEQRAVALGLALRRARSAVAQLESRLTVWNRADTERRAEAERSAVIERHRAAVAEIEARYPQIANELADLFGALVAAHREADRARVVVDGAVAGRLGIVGAMGNIGIVHLPKIEAEGGTHWPREKTAEERRAIGAMMRGNF